MKDMLTLTLAPTSSTTSSSLTTIRFDEPDAARFEAQSALPLLPRLLTLPLETLLRLLTQFLAEDSLRDDLLGALAETLCAHIDQQVLQQTRFSLQGALKMEEIVRALQTCFARHSSQATLNVRHKFARVREVLSVLTSADAASATSNAASFGSFVHVTQNEVEALLLLRTDL